MNDEFPVSSDDPMPLWRQVLSDLERRLAEGEFEERFPTDRELVATYGTSRHTVREATRHLKARGIIERARGSGSIVTASQVVAPLGALSNLHSTVIAAGRRSHSQVLTLQERKDPAAAKRLNRGPDETLVHLERVRFMDDTPFALDSVFMVPEVGRRIMDVDFTDLSVYDEVLRVAGVRPTEGREDVAAVVPSDGLRDVLELEPDEGVLRIDRCVGFEGSPFECRVTWLRSSQVRLGASWPGTDGFCTEVLQTVHTVSDEVARNVEP